METLEGTRKTSGQLLKFEKLDGLWDAVFGDREVFRGEAFDGISALVFNRDGLDDKGRAGLKGRVGCGAGLFVLADLFIWGDENEYLLRCRSAGFRVGTCTGALHFHHYVKPRLSSRLKFYHLYRNSMYIERLYFRLMHPAWLRPFYPLYLSLRLLGNLPSLSPSYLLCLLHGARRARRGELVPFPDKPRAGAVATVGPETA